MVLDYLISTTPGLEVNQNNKKHHLRINKCVLTLSRYKVKWNLITEKGFQIGSPEDYSLMYKVNKTHDKKFILTIKMFVLSMTFYRYRLRLSLNLALLFGVIRISFRLFGSGLN